MSPRHYELRFLLSMYHGDNGEDLLFQLTDFVSQHFSGLLNNIGGVLVKFGDER